GGGGVGGVGGVGGGRGVGTSTSGVWTGARTGVMGAVRIIMEISDCWHALSTDTYSASVVEIATAFVSWRTMMLGFLFEWFGAYLLCWFECFEYRARVFELEREWGTNYANTTPNVVNACLGSYLTLCEAQGHSPTSANEGYIGPILDGNGVVASPAISTSTPSVSNSYANVTGKPSRKSVDCHTLFIPAGNEVDVVVPIESIRAISERFANTAYGFFLGKLVAYPVVANYFSSMDGLNAMLENGMWFIHYNPLILKKWNSNVNLLKEDVGNAPVRVKLHGVPVTTFSRDGLGVISTKLGTPLILDSYTSDMCMQSRGSRMVFSAGFATSKHQYAPKRMALCP
ncbi:beta-caryophyllene synthase, partial [Tanacetum coccineum]